MGLLFVCCFFGFFFKFLSLQFQVWAPASLVTRVTKVFICYTCVARRDSCLHLGSTFVLNILKTVSRFLLFLYEKKKSQPKPKPAPPQPLGWGERQAAAIRRSIPSLPTARFLRRPLLPRSPPAPPPQPQPTCGARWALRRGPGGGVSVGTTPLSPAIGSGGSAPALLSQSSTSPALTAQHVHLRRLGRTMETLLKSGGDCEQRGHRGCASRCKARSLKAAGE